MINEEWSLEDTPNKGIILLRFGFPVELDKLTGREAVGAIIYLLNEINGYEFSR